MEANSQRLRRTNLRREEESMRRVSIMMLVLMGLLTHACTVGPKYKRPSAPVPPNYKEPPPANYKESDVWKQARPQDDVLRGKWWEIFGDPQLNALEEQVIVSNQNVAVAEAQFRAARAAIRAARADLFPLVTAGAAATVSRGSPNRLSLTGVTSGTGTFYQLPIDLSYEADVWGRVRSTVEANIANAQASAADIETVRLSSTAELALDYFALRGLDEEERLFEASIAAYQQALQLTNNRRDQGIASELDVAQAQTQLETTRTQAIDLGVARAQFEHAIAILIGKPPAELTISSTSIGGEPPVIPPGLPSELLERRPDIAAAERRMASANAQIGAAKAAFFPTITLGASAGVESSKIASLLSWPSRFWSIGPSLIQTVFDGGRRGAIVEETKAIYDSTVAAYRQDVLAALQEVEDNLAAQRIIADEARQQDVAIQSAQRLLDLSTNRYRGGIATYLEVIVAQTALLTNQRSAIDIRTRRLTASVLLVKALGGGWNISNLPQF
jgi:NodT family efflux transporter outer membrane factor (OMF) lipoprotein